MAGVVLLAVSPPAPEPPARAPPVAPLEPLLPPVPAPLAPVLPAPVLPAPVLPAPVLPAPVLPAPAPAPAPAPVLPALVLPAPVLPAPVLPDAALDPVLPLPPVVPESAVAPRPSGLDPSGPSKRPPLAELVVSRAIEIPMATSTTIPAIATGVWFRNHRRRPSAWAAVTARPPARQIRGAGLQRSAKLHETVAVPLSCPPVVPFATRRPDIARRTMPRHALLSDQSASRCLPALHSQRDTTGAGRPCAAVPSDMCS